MANGTTAPPTRQFATTPQALPPFYQIAKNGSQNIQASEAMWAWMQLITNQTAYALSQLPANAVTTDPTVTGGLPENLVLVGGSGTGSTAQPIPDPGQPNDVLVSGGPGQRPRWVALAAIHPTVALANSQPLPEVTPEQQAIIDQIVALLHELIRLARTA